MVASLPPITTAKHTSRDDPLPTIPPLPHLPHLRPRGLFSTYPLHNRVLRVLLVHEVRDSQQKKRMPKGDFITGLPGHKGKLVRIFLEPAGSL